MKLLIKLAKFKGISEQSILNEVAQELIKEHIHHECTFKINEFNDLHIVELLDSSDENLLSELSSIAFNLFEYYQDKKALELFKDVKKIFIYLIDIYKLDFPKDMVDKIILFDDLDFIYEIIDKNDECKFKIISYLDFDCSDCAGDLEEPIECCLKCDDMENCWIVRDLLKKYMELKGDI